MEKKETVIGIDPGSNKCGWAIVSYPNEELIASGVIVLKHAPLANRLLELFNSIVELVNVNKPTVAVVESVYCGPNLNALAPLAHARGVIVVALAMHGMKVWNMAAKRIRMAVTSNGATSKQEMLKFVNEVFFPEDPITSTDESDAIAAALSYDFILNESNEEDADDQ